MIPLPIVVVVIILGMLVWLIAMQRSKCHKTVSPTAVAILWFVIPFLVVVIVVIQVVLIVPIPVLTARCHAGVSPIAVYIRIGDTLASCCRGNNAKDANLVNYYAKGQASQKCVTYCCAPIMICATLTN